MNYQLINLADLSRVRTRYQLPDGVVAEAGFAWVPILPRPSEDAGEGMAWRRVVTAEADGWEAVAVAVAEVDVIGELGAAFDRDVPEGAKAGFLPLFARVRTLIEAGRVDLARLAIESEVVDEELEFLRVGFLGMLDDGESSNF